MAILWRIEEAAKYHLLSFAAKSYSRDWSLGSNEVIKVWKIGPSAKEQERSDE
jgi:hypothetical protein